MEFVGSFEYILLKAALESRPIGGGLTYLHILFTHTVETCGAPSTSHFVQNGHSTPKRGSTF